MISFLKFIVRHTTHFLWSIIRKTVNSIYETIQLNMHFVIEVILKSYEKKIISAITYISLVYESLINYIRLEL